MKDFMTPQLDILCSMYPSIKHARALGREAHDSIKQVRKYTGLPYWSHTEAVAELVADACVGRVHNIIQITLGVLFHDIREDVPAFDLGLDQLKKEYGEVDALKIDRIVFELTNKYTKERFPHLNRAARKELEAKRLREIFLPESRIVKLADIIDNTRDIGQHDAKFAKTYCAEKMAYFDSLYDEGNEANAILFARAKGQLS